MRQGEVVGGGSILGGPEGGEGAGVPYRLDAAGGSAGDVTGGVVAAVPDLVGLQPRHGEGQPEDPGAGLAEDVLTGGQNEFEAVVGQQPVQPGTEGGAGEGEVADDAGADALHRQKVQQGVDALGGAARGGAVPVEGLQFFLRQGEGEALGGKDVPLEGQVVGFVEGDVAVGSAEALHLGLQGVDVIGQFPGRTAQGVGVGVSQHRLHAQLLVEIGLVDEGLAVVKEHHFRVIRGHGKFSFRGRQIVFSSAIIPVLVPVVKEKRGRLGRNLYGDYIFYKK